MFWRKPKKYKIGVLYICTGKYDIYWEQFYASSEKNFCPQDEKHYFVFTDSQKIKAGENVTLIHQERLGWPDDTLMRFHMFVRAQDLMQDCDYLFFFNANMHFAHKIRRKDILPTASEQLVAVIHPYYYDSPIGAPFESNKESLAFVAAEQARHYVQGCVNGGLSKAYLAMAQTLANHIDQDKYKGIVAVWHDESHLNAYLVQHPNYKALHAGFAKPEGRVGFPFKEKIINLNKNNQGGLDYFRN